MDRFEYRTDVVEYRLINDAAYPNIPEFEMYLLHYNGWEDKSMHTSLDELGADGWELVCISEAMSKNRETPWQVATFKRKINQEVRK